MADAGEAERERRRLEALERGIDRFNRGEYHPALDELDVAYHEGGRARLELALIRAAAALHHFERGAFHSALRLYRSGREVLAGEAAGAGSGSGTGPRGLRLDLDGLLAALDEVFVPLVAAGEGEAQALRPASRPQVRRLG